jgi:IS30 family transposase
MKCGPDNCPLPSWIDLTPAERKVQRAAKAKELYERKFTEEQIGKLLGVAQSTISEDLRDLSTVDKSKPAKTASNPAAIVAESRGTR